MRKHQWIALALSLMLLLSLTGCGAEKESREEVFSMNALIDIVAYGRHAEQGIADASAVYSSMEALLDPELESSKVYAINHAGGEATVVNAQLAGMIQTAQTVSSRTDGALDLTLYPLIKAWGFLDEQFTVPDEATITPLLENVGMDRISLSPDQENSGYLLTMPEGTQITLAAVARGAATGYAISALRAAGVDSAYITMGGNVQTLGLKPDGSKWNIAVMDPNDSADYIGYLTLGETAVVTTASTDVSFTTRGALYHHILNPENGEPANSGLRSVTIICNDGQLADCLSTALFVKGERAALNYWRTYGGFEMLLVTNDWRIVATDGLYGVFTTDTKEYTVSYVK